MEHVIVESSFDAPLSPEREHKAAQIIDKELADTGGRWLRSYISPDRRRMICEFMAAGVEPVRTSYDVTSLPVERIWVASVYTEETAEESA